MTVFCKIIENNAVKFKDVKTRRNLTGSSRVGHGSKRTVLSRMMMMNNKTVTSTPVTETVPDTYETPH
jgi:hypothetical protein